MKTQKLSIFEKEIDELNKRLENHYELLETRDRKWIKDGIVDLKTYFESNYKILWILKEPRDGENNTGGGWSIVENIRKVRSEGLNKDSSATFHPITYVTYAILNNIDEFDKLDKNKIYKEYSKSLKNIGYINIQKLPASSKSNNKNILKYFNENKVALLDQIKTINPDIIICTAGNDTFKKLKESVLSDCELKGKILINAYHPAQTSIKREIYVNKIIHEVKTAYNT